MKKYLVILFLLNYCQGQLIAQQEKPLVLDMVHHNPGEPYTVSAFTDPATLPAYGFNGQVINKFTPPHSAITYDTVSPSVFPVGSMERNWADHLAARIHDQIRAVHSQGLKAFYFMDIILFPKTLVEIYKNELCDEAGRIDWDKPKTQKLHRIMIREVFDCFPEVDGFVIRTGENYR
ncbi:MAG: hypothetical protein LUD15_11000 [Bacteroides sp.]|nr:hypothetical protein [Bacteroides sp.]